MGSGASTADPFNLSPEEKEKFVESLLHGEVTNLAAAFAAELDRIHNGDVTTDEVKQHLTKTLTERRLNIAEKIKLREEQVAKEDAERAMALSMKVASEADAKYAKQVTIKNTNLMRRAAKTFMVGVDGSNSADVAFNVGMSLRKKVDNIVVFHTYKAEDENGEVLPYQYRPNVIRTKYEALLVSSLPSHNYFLGFHARPDDKSAKQAIIDVIDKTSVGAMTPAIRLLIGNNAPDFLCVGFSGRKSEMENREFMGSKADLALRTVHVPIIVCKRPISSQDANGEPKLGKVFVFAVALTDTSRRGLDILLTLLGPKDELIIVHCQENNDQSHTTLSDLEKAQQYYENELRLFGPLKSKFISIEPINGVSTVDRLSDYVNYELDVDFLVIAPRATQTVSSISEALILKCKTNVVLCKT